MIKLSPFTSRVMWFAVSLLLNVAVFLALMNIKLGSPTPPMPDSLPLPVHMIKIAPPAPPPPPPELLPPSVDIASGGLSAAAAPAPLPITVQAPSVSIPTPDLKGTGQALHLTEGNSAQGGTGLSSDAPGNGGSGSGNNAGDGASGMADIGGLKIGTGENIAVLYDNSGSMDEVTDYIQKCVLKFFLDTEITNNDGCVGDYIPGDTTQEKTDDFYYAGYKLEKDPHHGKPITALVMISDWEDGAYLSATAAFVDSLREHHIKLFLLSVECTPYQGLVDYAKESGGQVSITTKLAIKALK